MPAIRTCPLCGFSGAHGFGDPLPYAMYYFHGDCRYLLGQGGKVFRMDTKGMRLYADWVARLDARYNDPVWQAGIVTGFRSNLVGWTKEIAHRLGISVAEGRARRNAWSARRDH